MKVYQLIFIFLVLVSCTIKEQDEDKPDIELPDSIKAINRNENIGAGINLGNALEAPNEGEWNSIIYCDNQSRLLWTEFVRRQIEKNGFSSTYFDFGVHFRVYDLENDHWLDGFLSALLEE